MYVRMYVCMYIRTCVCTYICVYVHTWWSCLGILMNVPGFQHVVFWRGGFLMATRVLFAMRTELDFQINGWVREACRARAAPNSYTLVSTPGHDAAMYS